MEEDWKDNLSIDAKGNALKTISNLRMIFTHDENLRQIRFDTFCQDDISFSPLFCNVNGNKVDEESVGKIQDYLEQNYDLRLTQNKVFEILKTTASERNFNPVQDYIRKEEWDGTPRIEAAIIDYLGAEDTPLIREQTKLWFVAAVARAFEPGCKFDNVLTLPGPQGIGKSTFFKVIGDRWFNDSFSFASGDKEKVETITNGWIIEISELNGMKRANDAEAAKAFLSRRSDCMRPAYGRKPIEDLRHNVFAATTNETYYIKGTNLYLSPELEAEANEVQMCHSSILNDPILDDIRLYLERLVPKAYDTWSIPMRAAYQKGAYTEATPNSKPEVLLNMVCARQIIEELPNDLVRRNPAKYTAQYINRLMSLVDGWERSEQEKVKGLHPSYCDKTGRTKHPWMRISAQQKEQKGKEEDWQSELPF